MLLFGFEAKLLDPSGNRGEHLLELTQLSVNRLKTHQPGYFFTQCTLHE